jgi:hypothetical protein
MKRGLVGEFATPAALLAATVRLRALGYTRLDAFTPYPVEEVTAALALPRSRIPVVVLAAALSGGAFGYLVQWWTTAVSWPLNVGGRPLHSAPAFIPITFESAVLFGAVAAFASLMIATGLPRLWHPLFEVEGFASASIDRFWIAVDRTDPSFVARQVDAVLHESGALRVAPFGDDP